MYIILAFLGGLAVGVVVSAIAIDARIDRITAQKIDELTIEDAVKISVKLQELLDSRGGGE